MSTTTTKKPKSKRIQQDVPSLFFILSSFAKSKKASLPKSSSTNNGEEDVINCDKVLQEVNNLSIELPELSQSSTSITHADPLLSPDCGWYVLYAHILVHSKKTFLCNSLGGYRQRMRMIMPNAFLFGIMTMSMIQMLSRSCDA